ncbi:unnamed protein product [Thelazia callipaeda]|uniref:Uncharacterized protein n=1 Tax=Thelazia callipaeda TaxID=103827 RepID=A0A0N5CPK5_THECL|nr:unnamed protein product [Thelazia callipaeda]
MFHEAMALCAVFSVIIVWALAAATPLPESSEQLGQIWTEWVADNTRDPQLETGCLTSTSGTNPRNGYTDDFFAVTDEIDRHQRRRRGPSCLRIDPSPVRHSIPSFEAANLGNYSRLEKEGATSAPSSICDCNLARCPLMRTEAFASIRVLELQVVKTGAHALDGFAMDEEKRKGLNVFGVEKKKVEKSCMTSHSGCVAQKQTTKWIKF